VAVKAASLFWSLFGQQRHGSGAESVVQDATTAATRSFSPAAHERAAFLRAGRPLFLR
jgi:hypothetical protein